MASPPPFHRPPPNPSPSPNLLSLLSNLRSLLSRASASLLALPRDLLAAAAASTSSDLAVCPFNSGHRVPPEALFRHSLHCPTSATSPEATADLLASLHYPSAATSTGPSDHHQPHFLGPPPDAGDELYFSLPAAGRDHFYADCPGVVTTPSPSPAAAAATFSLPGFLAAECANFASCSGANPARCPGGILPSELWFLRREVEAWQDLPASYSYATLRAAAALGCAVEPKLKRWVILNSPGFGVVIDSVMRDHIWLLVKLCLKAVEAEANCSLEVVWREEEGGVGGFGPRIVRFDCPRLVGSLSWLASQLAILYGEVNGKFFAVGMIKEAMLQSGSSSVMGVGGGVVGSGENGELRASGGAARQGSASGDVGTGPVFVSQVAAAIAALHERFFLEEKIKALRFSRQPSRSQLLLEYSYALTRGNEERAKRPNYRPVLEYDGLLSHGMHNQDSGKSKTREELLAEERDYKRRRMSYRGKKVKRNQTEILRDIIDEHMEEIRQAGGIGCLVKGPEENAPRSMLESNSQGGRSNPGIYDLHGSSFDNIVLSSTSPIGERSTHADLSTRAIARSHDRRNSRGKFRHENYENDNHRRTGHENKGTNISGGASTHRSYSRQHEHNRHQRKSNDKDRSGYKYKRDDSDYHFESNNCTTWSTLTSKSVKGEHDHMIGHRSNDKSRTNQSRCRSESVTQDLFDRYDPTITHSQCDTPKDASSNGSEKYHGITKGQKAHDEIYHHGCYTGRHNQYH